MSRMLKVAATQLGPISRSDSRTAVVRRMIALMRDAKGRGAEFIVYPELALTTFFPRWYYEDRAEADQWFEAAMPGPETQPLFDAAKELGIAMSFGYAELTPDGHHYNTSILVDRSGRIVGKYRKVHLPGHAELDEARAHQHLEKRYFEPGNLGFPVWRFENGLVGMAICNDRRWPETYRVMGLQGVEMVVLGYNTPTANGQSRGETLADRMFHHRLSVQAGAYQNSTWVVAVAKTGVEDGHGLFGGTLIAGPDGKIVGELDHEEDVLLIHDCDLDSTRFGKETIFNFAAHRRVEHYGLLTSRTGAGDPLGQADEPPR